MKEKTSKELRKEIYDWIEIYVGKLPNGSKSYLSEKLKNYVKNHNQLLTKINNELFEAINEKDRLIDELRNNKIRNKHKEITCHKVIKRDLILE